MSHAIYSLTRALSWKASNLSCKILPNQALQNQLYHEVSRTFYHSSSPLSQKKKLNQPMTATKMPRPGGIASFMRLPIQDETEGIVIINVMMNDNGN